MDSNMTVGTPPVVKQKRMLKRETKRKIFFYSCILLPMLQFLLFYVYVNLDMIAMTFRAYEPVEGQLSYAQRFAGFDNFSKVLLVVFNPDKALSQGVIGVGAHKGLVNMIPQTFAFYLMSLSFLPCGILFAYYIYKNYPLSGLFRIMLYMPNIVSGVLMTMLFQFVLEKIFGIMEMNLFFVILYNFVMGFGVNVVMYVSAMCSIDESISESCQLDGASAIKEFWFVTVPMIFPTVVTFLVMGIAGIFGQSANLFTFFGEHASSKAGVQTVGYFMYINQIKSDIVIPPGATNAIFTFPELSAMGLLITLVVVPLTLTTRRLLEKYGPNEN